MQSTEWSPFSSNTHAIRLMAKAVGDETASGYTWTAIATASILGLSLYACTQVHKRKVDEHQERINEPLL